MIALTWQGCMTKILSDLQCAFMWVRRSKVELRCASVHKCKVPVDPRLVCSFVWNSFDSHFFETMMFYACSASNQTFGSLVDTSHIKIGAKRAVGLANDALGKKGSRVVAKTFCLFPDCVENGVNRKLACRVNRHVKTYDALKCRAEKTGQLEQFYGAQQDGIAFGQEMKPFEDDNPTNRKYSKTQFIDWAHFGRQQGQRASMGERELAKPFAEAAFMIWVVSKQGAIEAAGTTWWFEFKNGPSIKGTPTGYHKQMELHIARFCFFCPERSAPRLNWLKGPTLSRSQLLRTDMCWKHNCCDKI